MLLQIFLYNIDTSLQKIILKVIRIPVRALMLFILYLLNPDDIHK